MKRCKLCGYRFVGPHPADTCQSAAACERRQQSAADYAAPRWWVIDAPKAPARLHLVGGPAKVTRGPLREPIGHEHALPRCERCVADLVATA